MPADVPTRDPEPVEPFDRPSAALDQLGYAEAVAELEEILAQLDGDDVDVDHLAAQVRRAASLIALCRDRLTSARVEVTRIVADLDALTTAAAASADEEEENDVAVDRVGGDGTT